jgi:hypothetical protein
MKKTVTAFIAVFALATSAFGQTVYKCKDANGNMVFSQSPCASPAPVAETCIDADGKERPGACSKPKQDDFGGLIDPAAQQAQANAAAQADQDAKHERPSAVQDIIDSADDANCRRDAKNRYVYPSTDAVDRALAEIQSIQKSTWFVTGRDAPYKAATLEQNDQQRIATLRQVIATESARNDAIRAESEKRLQADLAECDRKKSERESPHR